MYRFYISGVGPEEMRKIEGDFRKMTNRGADETAQQLVKELKGAIVDFRLRWSNFLFDSIEAFRISRTQTQVVMASHGPMLEEGFEIPPGRLPPLLRQWAIEKMGNLAYGWLKKVEKGGHIVQARPFISNAIFNIEKQIDSIMDKNMRRVK